MAVELPVKAAVDRVDTVRVRPIPTAWQTSGHDAPVFVDESGRRAHGVNVAGAAVVLLCACWLATLALGMSGFTRVPGSPLPGLARVHATRQRILDVDHTAKATEFAGERGARRGRDTYVLENMAR